MESASAPGIAELPPPAVPGHHLMLRPGTPVMMREPGTVQVGLEPPTVRLPDAPDTRSVLARLHRIGGIRPEEVDAAIGRLLRRLDAAGLLIAVPDDERAVDPALEALRAQFGNDAVRRHAARVDASVAVHAAPEDTALVAVLLEEAGLAQTTTADLAAAVHLVVARGPVDRELLDPLVHGSVPHLVVSGGAGRRRVGPFVEPGRTACQRCVDAHEALHDVRLPLLVCQAVRTAHDRPPPGDPLLDRVAFAWAVRDLVRYVEGDEPGTWSTTVDLRPNGLAEQVRWGRHPECGCAWDVLDLC